VIIAYDHDEAGDRAAEKLAEDVDESGILAGEVARALPYARRELLEEIRRIG